MPFIRDGMTEVNGMETWRGRLTGNRVVRRTDIHANPLLGALDC
jgi:hypothetical protein